MATALVCAGSFSLYAVITRMLTTETLRANMFYTALGVFAAPTLYVAGTICALTLARSLV